jgi:hypothetical protein
MLTHQWFTYLSAATVLTHRLSILITIAAVLLACPVGPLRAGNSATSVVEFGVTEISAMDVTGILVQPITLTTSAPGTVELNGIGDTYIRYTSVVQEGKTRTISATITSGSIPDGYRLKLSIVGLNGNGSCGHAVGDVIYLTDNPQEIITGIGNCCTGTNDTDGARIECALEVEDASRIIAHVTSTVTVLFTMN